jgi:hypothetical protein
MKRVLFAVVVAVFLLGACGDDGGDSADGDGELDAAAVDKVKVSLVDADQGFGLSDAEAQCVAESVVGQFGTERSNEIDWEAETPPFTEGESKQAAAAFDECLDLNVLFTRVFTEDATVSDESKTCLEGAIDEGDARAFLEEVFLPTGEGPSEETTSKLDAALEECLTAEEYAEVNG